LNKIEQVVRLIRSKGVGVFFVTQNPLDIPDDVLAQLGNRVQHALRAFTKRDQKAVRAAAETFRENPQFDTEEMITQMGLGEALVSFLNDKGAPSIVDTAAILPPESRIGPVDESDMKKIIEDSTMFGKYAESVDRESAFEILKEKAEKQKKAEEELVKQEAKYDYGKARRATRKKKSSKGFGYWAYKTANSRVGKQLGREIVRGVLGGLFGTGSKR
ncbi:MAG: helicase HerA-like domain-containing protein, partial [Draconibacterium sp.]|nr:helicase HerA-like domain-containing protein [Draconibacterium sp.]